MDFFSTCFSLFSPWLKITDGCHNIRVREIEYVVRFSDLNLKDRLVTHTVARKKEINLFEKREEKQKIVVAKIYLLEKINLTCIVHP